MKKEIKPLITLPGLCGLFLLLSAAVPTGGARASGGDGGDHWDPFAPEYFVPAADLPDYAGGKLGVVPGSFWRLYHFLAYRVISGHPLGKEEALQLNIHGWQVNGSGRNWDSAYDPKANGLETWQAARLRVKDTAPVKIEVLGNAGSYGEYINCPLGAFERAAQTLVERLNGADEPNVRLWLQGQDAVFANCHPPAPWPKDKVENDSDIPVVLPPALPGHAPAWLTYDREYQTAAAYFYAERFDQARAGFLAIAKNAQSPWQPLGNYLAARCLIRKATLFYTSGQWDEKDNSARLKTRTELLSTARTELLSASRTYPPARELMGYVEAQLQPYEYLQTLGGTLAAGKLGGDNLQQLSDYFMLLDRTDVARMMQAEDPLTAWIGLMQVPLDYRGYGNAARNTDALDRLALDIARKHLQAGNNTALWLLPLVTHAKANDLSAAERQAALALAETSPGYQSVQYQLARIAIAEKKLNDADALVTRMLARYQAGMSKANRNRWLALKVVTAKTENEFVQALPRALTDVPGVPVPDESAKRTAPAIYDTDYAQHLYHDFSLADLKVLIANKHFQAQNDHRSLKEIMWTRAVLLGDFKTADELTDTLIPGRDTTKHLYTRFQGAQSEDEKRLAAMLILVNAPELMPAVSADLDETGCGALRNSLCQSQPPNFLPAEAYAAARTEQKKLRQLSVEAFITPILLAWAAQKPSDPEAPKALHFYIAGKRSETKNSRMAFQLLHKHYPNSAWAVKTKYYY
jgi:hypothetical protein